MYDIEYCTIALWSGDRFNADCQKYSVGGIPDGCSRCRCYWLYNITYRQKQRPCAVGSRSSVLQGNRQSVFAWTQSYSDDPRLCQQSGRRPLGNGRRIELQGPVWRDWRDMGRSPRAQFHCNKAACDAGRGEQLALLAGAARGVPQSECSAGSMAHRFTSLAASSARSASPRRTTLAGRIIPLAHETHWHMGGQL